MRALTSRVVVRPRLYLERHETGRERGGVLLSLTETYVSFFDEFGAEPMDLGKPGWGKH